MVIAQGDVYWADLPIPQGSEPGYRRPVVVIQGDATNQSGINTYICVMLTRSLKWARAQGNVILSAGSTGLPSDSVANVSQIYTLDENQLEARTGRLTRRQVDAILHGIDVVLGRGQRA